jgi:outer membrane murein-binding lipoprotein Lpp
MSTNVDNRISSLTVSLVVLAVVVATVGYYGWQKVNELEDQVTQLDQTVGTLQTRLNAANARLIAAEAATQAALQAATTAQSEIQAIAGVDAFGAPRTFGGFGGPRNMTDLDNALETVEQCLRSVVDIVEGLFPLLDFRCDSLPNG